jgi:hypothetical protein
MSHQDWIKAPVPPIESADPCDREYPTYEGPVEGNGSPVTGTDPAPVGSAEPHPSSPAEKPNSGEVATPIVLPEVARHALIGISLFDAAKVRK